MYKLKKLKAFTLAEALIALTIVAIIAALCIPVMKRDNFRAQIETGVKKGYYTLEASLDRAIAKDFKFADWDTSNMFTEKMVPELNIARVCGEGGNCLGSDEVSVSSSYILADGISIGENEDTLFVDGNGLDEPNKLGVDIYVFKIKKITDDYGNATLKIEPVDPFGGTGIIGFESAVNLVKNGWKITAW